MELFLSASIHQGNDLFSVYSRGRQCAFMCLSALLTARNNPVVVWSKTTLNNVLLQAWALTIHKSQCLTLPKAWIDIGKSERPAGVSYVAISQVKSLASCVIEPMTYERLTCLKSSANLQCRLEEENRLDQLPQTTSCAFRAENC